MTFLASLDILALDVNLPHAAIQPDGIFRITGISGTTGAVILGLREGHSSALLALLGWW